MLWDMDGTLVDTEPYWIATEQAMAEKYGATWTHADALTLVGSGLSHRVRGIGIDHLGGVRFHQKDLGPDGRDVRVWTITHPGDHVLLAQHCPASEPPAARRDPAQRQSTG